MSGLIAPAEVMALSPYVSGSIGSDVSWPNCGTKPLKGAAFGILGVTGGLVFAPNQCLFDESHWFYDQTLYVNTGYAGKARAEKYAGFPRQCAHSDEACLAYNYGYNAGIYAVFYAASQFVHSDYWWLDVETENSWSGNTDYNRASLQGMVDAITRQAFLPKIGFYSYPGQWKTITGNWHNGYPAWVATGSEKRDDAINACKEPSFNGGKNVLAQYTTRLDEDFACN